MANVEWRPCDFERAAIAGTGTSCVLEVSGWTSYGTELKPQVKLSPAVYVAQPEWWDIAILERADAIFPEGDPYKVTLDLAHCKGKKGVRVVGKRKRQELPWPQTPTR